MFLVHLLLVLSSLKIVVTINFCEKLKLALEGINIKYIKNTKNKKEKTRT